MQLFTSWPDLTLLDLPENVKTALFLHLNAPFHNEAETRSYWQDNKPTLIILNKDDTKSSLSKLEPFLQQKIMIMLTTPEYTDELGSGYTIKLAVINDAGEGVYCIQETTVHR